MQIIGRPFILLSRPIKVVRTGTYSDSEPKRIKPLSSLREFHWYTDMILIVGKTCYRTLTLTAKTLVISAELKSEFVALQLQ